VHQQEGKRVIPCVCADIFFSFLRKESWGSRYATIAQLTLELCLIPIRFRIHSSFSAFRAAACGESSHPRQEEHAPCFCITRYSFSRSNHEYPIVLLIGNCIFRAFTDPARTGWRGFSLAPKTDNRTDSRQYRGQISAVKSEGGSQPENGSSHN
jgi:hypothetical protein